MNRRMVFNMTGRIVLLEAAVLLLPLLVSVIYGETNAALAFLSTLGIAAVTGGACVFFVKPRDREFYAKEGFIIVALSWIALSLVGALPFTLSGEIPSYVDAVFETVSGFTTTGASILALPENLSHGMLFWRSFTHWIGGMGVLVLIMAIIPSKSGRNMHILRAEMPGPIIGKLVPRIKDTAKILYLIYLAMTAVQVIILVIFDMPFFDSLLISFGTAGTGGFGINSASMGNYNVACKWTVAIFMAVFGVNFNLYYLLLIKRKVVSVIKSTELQVYLVIILVSAAIIFFNIYPLYGTVGESALHSVFQVSSVVTTTGYSTVDFNLWPTLSKAVLLLLMFMGSCAGSTAGGLKVSRFILLLKIAKRELKKMLHPRSVGTVKLEGKSIENDTVNATAAYFIIYVMIFAVVFLLLSFDTSAAFDLETNISAAASCFNNIGPALGIAGPASSYAAYSDFSKTILSFAMLFGRLEIYPILFALVPSTWRNKA